MEEEWKNFFINLKEICDVLHAFFYGRIYHLDGQQENNLKLAVLLLNVPPTWNIYIFMYLCLYVFQTMAVIWTTTTAISSIYF